MNVLMCVQWCDVGEYPEKAVDGASDALIAGAATESTDALLGGVAGEVVSVQAAAAIIAARARKDLRTSSLQVHGNPTGIARSLGALASRLCVTAFQRFCLCRGH